MFHIFKDEAGEWRWSLVEERNHSIVATSGEGYRRPSGCEKAIERAKRLSLTAGIVRVVKAPTPITAEAGPSNG